MAHDSTCKFYNKCDAPLCPMDIDLSLRIWYTDEPICRKRTMHKEHLFLRLQKRMVGKVDYDIPLILKEILEYENSFHDSV